jgi:hypothetical protein
MAINQDRLRKILQFWAAEEVYDMDTINSLEGEMVAGSPPSVAPTITLPPVGKVSPCDQSYRSRCVFGSVQYLLESIVKGSFMDHTFDCVVATYIYLIGAIKFCEHCL